MKISEEQKERNRECARRWKKNNIEKVKQARKKYYEANKNKELNQNKRWKEENKEHILATKSEVDKKYREANKDKLKEKRTAKKAEINKRAREKYRNNINHALTIRLRRSLGQALNLADVKKTVTTFKLIGIPIQEFKIYLETKFVEGMSWDNRQEWHIDHIKPCASFDLSQEDQQIECFHYTNFQPLWKKDNHRKGSKYNGIFHRYKKLNKE